MLGTILTMQRHPFWITICLLVLLVTSSCASSPDLKPTVVPPAHPSPTPFQPGVYDLPSSVPTFDSQSIPTFTPYPTIILRNGINPTPAQVSSSNNDRSSITIDPLTGLPPADPILLQRRPLAITVTNYPPYVRPQAGLTLADVVFEYYEEPFYTRFFAVFYGNNADMVGPVRSGRYFNEHVVRMYHAFFVFQYADPRELMYFKSGDLNPFLVLQGSGSCPPFLDPGIHETYNDAFFDIAKWNDCAAQLHLDNSPQNLRSGFFSETPPSRALAGNRIFTVYSAFDYNYWQYDPASERYLRYQETDDTQDNKPASYAPLTDYLNGRQVASDNVVVLFVSHTFMNENEQEDNVFHINLIDSGNAVVFRNGLAIPAYWVRTDINQPLLITNLDGSPIYMKPGQTFFQVIGETSTYRTDGTNWYFGYQTP
jgi:hypothetical protein